MTAALQWLLKAAWQGQLALQALPPMVAAWQGQAAGQAALHVVALCPWSTASGP